MPCIAHTNTHTGLIKCIPFLLVGPCNKTTQNKSGKWNITRNSKAMAAKCFNLFI